MAKRAYSLFFTQHPHTSVIASPAPRGTRNLPRVYTKNIIHQAVAMVSLSRGRRRGSHVNLATFEVEDEPEPEVEEAPVPKETRRGGNKNGDAGVVFADDETARAFGFRSGRD